MATKNKVNIISDIVAEIKSGNSDTTAAGLRTILYEILDSYVNVKDGGLVYETAVGYNGLLTLTDAKSFVYKKWVEDYINKSIIDTAANFTANNPILSLGQFGIEIDNLVAVPKFKIGDGVNDWNTLPYANEGFGLLSLAQVLAIDNKTNGVPIKSNDSNTFLTIINGGATFQSDGNINHNAAQHIFLGNFSAMDSGGNTGFGFNASSFSIYTGVNKYYTLTSADATFRHTVKNTFNAPVHEFNNSVTKGGLELATENFVNNAIAGLKFKVDVVAASIANVNISSAPSSLDGVTLTIGDRVLLKNQSTATENGCYIFNGTSSAMTRATDSDTGAKLVSATYPVRGGTINQDTWFTVTNDAITIGSTNIVISQTAGNGTYTVGSYLKLIGNVFDIDFTTFSTTQITEGTNKYLSNSNLATVNHAATVKTTIVDADEVTGADSANSFSLFRTTWSNIMVYIKSKLFSKVNGGNANYSIIDSDKIIYTGTAFTAPRTYTLPSATSINGPKTIADFLGTITSTNTLTIGVQTGEYLNGVLNGTEVIQSAYGQRVLYPDGVNNWSFDAGIVRQTKTQTISNKTLDSTNIAVTQSAGDNSTKIATTAYVDAKVTDSITDGITTVAPSQNAVFDALGLKLTAANNLSDVPNPLTARNNLKIWSLFLTGGNQTTTSDVSSNITDLVSTTLTASKRYRIQGTIKVGCNNTGGVKFQITLPSGASMDVSLSGSNTSNTTYINALITSSATLSASVQSFNGLSILRVDGEISLGVTSGTIQFGFASGTNTQTSTVFQLGTHLTITQIN